MVSAQLLGAVCALHPLHPCSIWEKQPLAMPGRKAEGAASRGLQAEWWQPFSPSLSLSPPAHPQKGQGAASPQSHCAPQGALKSRAGTSQGNKSHPAACQCGTERLRAGPRHQPDPSVHRCAPAWPSWHRSPLAHPALCSISHWQFCQGWSHWMFLRQAGAQQGLCFHPIPIPKDGEW